MDPTVAADDEEVEILHPLLAREVAAATAAYNSVWIDGHLRNE